jgi:chaperonin cofactor prefoldin
MQETHSMLRADTTTLFERLREANILLQEVLSGAHENMSALENTLVTRVSEFVSTMNEVAERSGVASNQVDQHISAFHNTTSKVLNDLGQLAGQFETHGRSLVEAVGLIDKSNRRTEEQLGERRDSLENVMSTLDSRTADIEERLKRFSGLLDESLEGAAGRARDIARIIAESSNEGTRALTEQFEAVRTTSEQERRRTVETMRELYNDTTGETHSLFSQTTQRFTDTLQGMKQMAAEMQRELEQTRTELRRGILELPQETAESAAQMRRVIVDQIEALAELNRIVARHGRGIDTAEPSRRNAREEQQQPVMATANARMESARAEAPQPPRMEPPARIEPARMEMPRVDIPRPAPAPAARADITSASPPRRAESPSLSPVQQAPGNGRSGWLSDLLHRASRPEDNANAPIQERQPAPRNEERSPRHSIESLDSLSVDIARMIDHDAAAELWDRYKRGERNVFTRRLYTMQGQKTFDEIQKKYRADREFKQTVDRYIGEFERLLEEVARDDRGQVMARTYLTSETGKVYTMLAHAAGRFGE